MKLVHHLLKGATLTSALFVFQACYGTPGPMYEEGGEAPMSFTVVSQATGAPLKGIKVEAGAVESDSLSVVGTTDENGSCKLNLPYNRNLNGPFIRFEDPEGRFQPKDTVLTDLRERDIPIRLIENK
ncbi:MAG: hypothetical protein IJL86_08450 [Bacteroidales bacterium]|nr:hypothetical protein [Bacteroidales bacterium]MBR0029167.1 hypothetical protein [Bacteroidales bacterium]